MHFLRCKSEFGCGNRLFPGSTFQKELILTLLITLAVESTVVLGYSIWQKKLLSSILLTSILANLITQSFLWVVLNIFFRYYLLVLVIAEIFIWLFESFLLYRLPANRLRFQEAVLLSLNMNLASFALGWFLPI